MHANAAPTVVLMGAMGWLGTLMGSLVKKQIGAYSYAGGVAEEVSTVVLCVSILLINVFNNGYQNVSRYSNYKRIPNLTFLIPSP